MSVVLFAGGGTGGHLMPALAIAEAMVALDGAIRPHFVGSFRGVEAKVLPARPWPYTLLPFEPIYRRHWWRNVRLPLSLYRTFSGIRQLLRREQPVLAVGTGGYVAGPVLWAAMGRGIPGVLQEQNAFPGVTTRRLARRARQIHLGFPEAGSWLDAGPRTRVLFSGNPIVPVPVDRPTRLVAKGALGLDPERPLALVVGGSQGALAVNQVVAKALTSGVWPGDVQLLWQTGAGTYEQFRHLATPGVQVAAFLDPVADAYAAADLVIGRAGAMTLAELAAWGIPSILVPLPTAAADHQLTNARAMVEAGAAALIEQHRLSPEGLAEQVRTLLSDPAGMARMGEALLHRARPDAADSIAREVLQLLS